MSNTMEWPEGMEITTKAQRGSTMDKRCFDAPLDQHQPTPGIGELASVDTAALEMETLRDALGDTEQELKATREELGKLLIELTAVRDRYRSRADQRIRLGDVAEDLSLLLSGDE